MTERAPESAGPAGHPAPERGRIPLALLWFGIAGGPAAWTVQTLVDFPLAAHGCFPRLYPLAAPVTAGLRPLVVAVSVAALAVCAAAAVVAWRSWRRTRAEHREGSGGGRRHDGGTAALETGEGRTRFMALSGVLTSVTFLLVIAAHLATILLVPPCAG